MDEHVCTPEWMLLYLTPYMAVVTIHTTCFDVKLSNLDHLWGSFYSQKSDNFYVNNYFLAYVIKKRRRLFEVITDFQNNV
jgi:hypothetical protein